LKLVYRLKKGSVKVSETLDFAGPKARDGSEESVDIQEVSEGVAVCTGRDVCLVDSAADACDTLIATNVSCQRAAIRVQGWQRTTVNTWKQGKRSVLDGNGRLLWSIYCLQKLRGLRFALCGTLSGIWELWEYSGVDGWRDVRSHVRVIADRLAMSPVWGRWKSLFKAGQMEYSAVHGRRQL
jgi:hypothetical protein